MARRNHKERSQPTHRARMGLLEKHKDYVHRARDYKSKQDRIKKLREKAAFKNKDEFYFGMIKNQTKNGIAIADRGNKSLDTDLVKLLKTQDLGYLRIQIAKDEKKIRNLKAELEVSSSLAGPSNSLSADIESEWDAVAELAEVEKLAEMGIIIKPQELSLSSTSRKKGKGKGKAPAEGHVIFADDKEEFEKYGESSSPSIEDDAIADEEVVDLGWAEPIQLKKKNKQKVIELIKADIDEETIAEQAREHRMENLTLLSAYLGRIKLLRQAESKLEMTKGLMGKGGSAKKIRESGFVEDDTAPENKNGERTRLQSKLWKWKLERRR
ncbi:uncharacterized protein L201_004032 [Kwoniella dendrophila CBS 6074]|uniref:U3 small nucleolar RNA-associated protein 11 n=1 Tax=Kwoniella dendrophila CBS 6074 TaxID=1295534 RepID=A0AAX4JUR1_9TREE